MTTATVVIFRFAQGPAKVPQRSRKGPDPAGCKALLLQCHNGTTGDYRNPPVSSMAIGEPIPTIAGERTETKIFNKMQEENFESFGFVAFYFVLGCAERALKRSTQISENALKTTVEVLHKLIDQASWTDGRN